MEFRDTKLTIFNIFKNEYYYSSKYMDDETLTDNEAWRMFLAEKDLGIMSWDYRQQIYKIVDEHKWMLAKIKYGI